MAKLPPYLQKRANRFYAALNIPKELRRHYPGKGSNKTLYKLVQSLETDSLAVAKRRVGPVVSAWQSDFARLRDQPDDDTGYYRRRLKKAKNVAERSRIMAQIEVEAENLASPSYSDNPSPHEIAVTDAAAHKQAQEFYDKATGQIVGFTDHVEDWLDRSTVTDKTKSMQRSDLKRFGKAFPTVQDVTQEDVQKWIDGLGVAPKTTKRVLSALRGYWKYLQRHDVKAAARDFEPFHNLDLPRQKKQAKDTRKAFRPADVVKVLLRADRDRQLQDAIHLAMFTGCRIEELCSLRVKQVHLSSKIPYIEIEDAKTPAGWREIPIHPAIEDTFKKLLKEAKDGYVISGLTKNKYGYRSDALGKRFGRLKTSMKFGPDYVFHSIRKTVATLLDNAGIPEHVAADILGHEKPTMTYGLYSGGSSLEVKAKAIAEVAYGGKISTKKAA